MQAGLFLWKYKKHPPPTSYPNKAYLLPLSPLRFFYRPALDPYIVDESL